jgi:hypothetical protein
MIERRRETNMAFLAIENNNLISQTIQKALNAEIRKDAQNINKYGMIAPNQNQDRRDQVRSYIS